MTDHEVPLRPARLTSRIALCAAAALAAAIVTRLPELIAFAAPLLGALATGAARSRRAVVTVRVEPEEPRCFEGDEVRVTAECTARGCDDVELRIAAGHGVEVVEENTGRGADRISAEWVLRAPEWGRFAPNVRVNVRAAGGLLAGTDTVHPLHLRVFPRPLPATDSLSSADLPDRIGAHITRRHGEGVEFAGIRPYVSGDQLRTVNWPVSARKGRLYVTERLTERSADVLALIDTHSLYADPGAAAHTVHSREAMGLAVHGAAQVVQAALRRGDRAGVITLGGRLRWLGADIGRRQFYRVVDAVLEAYPVVGDSERNAAGHTDFVPRGVLPSGSIVVAFTPLLDGRIALALHDVRLRGYPVVVVDVLRDIPRIGRDEVDPLVARMWRLERGRMHRNFALLGIPVVAWREGTTLDEILTPLARRPLSARRPSG